MKRIIATMILACILASLAYIAFYGFNIPKEMTAARRPPHEQLDVVYIDDEAIALAGSPSADIEMRTLSVEAYEATNAYRESNGLASLIWSERLAMDAITRAREIEIKFSHTRPNLTDWYTVDSEHMYGENLAQGYNTSADVVTAWINSPSHRENLEDSEFLTCGISAWRGEDGIIFIAQEFGY